MIHRLLALSLLVATGCGGPEPTVIAATLRIDALLQDDVKSLTLYALGPQRSDGIMLVCSNLIDQVINPDDSRVEGLGRVDLAFSPTVARDVSLDDVAAGGGRIVFAEAKNAAGVLIANGCTEDITVASGETTVIEVDLYRL